MSDFLQIDVQLLLLRYGRTRVLQALACVDEVSLEDLERQLESIQPRSRGKTTRANPSVIQIVEEALQERPEVAEPLRKLAVDFENRTFLPHLRDVRRFLDRTGTSYGKLKSRAAATRIVIQTLAKLPPLELASLMQNSLNHDSDYELLARAIMRPQLSKDAGQK